MSDNEPAGRPGELGTRSRIFSRRRLLETGTLAVGGVALATGQRASAQEPRSVAAAEPGASASNPGPENEAFRALNPNSFTPPPTDHGLPQTFWSSFSGMRRHIQDGGWSRQVNVNDFPISKEIAGVNMRLTAGGIRELHWHKANEWALMLTGNCRLTALNFDGSPYVNDVTAGDLWYFPTGVPHSLQGLGPAGGEFLLVF
jgi:oxalate decarboxylase